MENNIRLYNRTKFNIGIVTPGKPYGQNIVPNGFVMVSQDDIDYLSATSSVLQCGSLQVDDSHKAELAQNLGIEMEDNANFMSDEDIRKKLSGNANQLKKWLNGDIEPYVLDKIAEIATTMNLSANKIQVLQDKLPNYEFIKK